MSSISDYKTKEEIIGIRFPTETMKSLTSRLQYPDKVADFSLVQAKTFLIVVVREFLKGNLYLEEMTEIVHHLGLYFMDHPSEDRIDGYTLDEITFDASEMNIDIRAVIGDPLHGTYDWYLLHLMEYLKVNAALTDSIEVSDYKTLSYFEQKYLENHEEIKKNLAYGENVVTKTGGP